MVFPVNFRTNPLDKRLTTSLRLTGTMLGATIPTQPSSRIMSFLYSPLKSRFINILSYKFLGLLLFLHNVFFLGGGLLKRPQRPFPKLIGTLNKESSMFLGPPTKCLEFTKKNKVNTYGHVRSGIQIAQVVLLTFPFLRRFLGRLMVLLSF